MKTLFSTLLILFSLSCFSQDYFIVKNDTTFCDNLKYSSTNEKGLMSITYEYSTKEKSFIELIELYNSVCE